MTYMHKSEARELLDGLCQQARNRLLSWGITDTEFFVVNCPNIDGLHIRVSRKGYPDVDYHIWSPKIDNAPWKYEQFMFQICVDIVAAIDFAKYLREVADKATQTFGMPPSHGGVWN